MATKLHRPNPIPAQPFDDEVLDISSTSSIMTISPPGSPTSPSAISPLPPSAHSPHPPRTPQLQLVPPHSFSSHSPQTPSPRSNSSYHHSLSPRPSPIPPTSPSPISPLHTPLLSPLPSPSTRPTSYNTHTTIPTSPLQTSISPGPIPARQLPPPTSPFARLSRNLTLGLGSRNVGGGGGGGIAGLGLGLKSGTMSSGLGLSLGRKGSVVAPISAPTLAPAPPSAAVPGNGKGVYRENDAYESDGERGRSRGRSTSIVNLAHGQDTGIGGVPTVPASALPKTSPQASKKGKKKKRKKKRGGAGGSDESASDGSGSGSDGGTGEEGWYIRYNGPYEPPPQGRVGRREEEREEDESFMDVDEFGGLSSRGGQGQSQTQAQAHDRGHGQPQEYAQTGPITGRRRGMSISSFLSTTSTATSNYRSVHSQLPIGSRSQVNVSTPGGFVTAKAQGVYGYGPGQGQGQGLGGYGTSSATSVYVTASGGSTPLPFSGPGSGSGSGLVKPNAMTMTTATPMSSSSTVNSTVRGKPRSSTVSGVGGTPLRIKTSVSGSSGSTLQPQHYHQYHQHHQQQQQQSTASLAGRSYVSLDPLNMGGVGESPAPAPIPGSGPASASTMASPVSGAVGVSRMGSLAGAADGKKENRSSFASIFGFGFGAKGRGKGREYEKEVGEREKKGRRGTFGYEFEEEQEVVDHGRGLAHAQGQGQGQEHANRNQDASPSKLAMGVLSIKRSLSSLSGRGRSRSQSRSRCRSRSRSPSLGPSMIQSPSSSRGPSRNQSRSGARRAVATLTPTDMGMGVVDREQPPSRGHSRSESRWSRDSSESPSPSPSRRRDRSQSQSQSESESRSTRRRWTIRTNSRSESGHGSRNASRDVDRSRSRGGSVTLSLGGIFGRKGRRKGSVDVGANANAHAHAHPPGGGEGANWKAEDEEEEDDVETRYHSIDNRFDDEDDNDASGGRRIGYVDEFGNFVVPPMEDGSELAANPGANNGTGAGAGAVPGASAGGAGNINAAVNANANEENKRTLTQMSYDYARGLVAYETITGTIKANAAGATGARGVDGPGSAAGGAAGGDGIKGSNLGSASGTGRVRDSYYDSYYSTLITSPSQPSFGAGAVRNGIDSVLEENGVEEEEGGRHPYLVRTTVQDEIRHTHPDPGPSADVFHAYGVGRGRGAGGGDDVRGDQGNGGGNQSRSTSRSGSRATSRHAPTPTPRFNATPSPSPSPVPSQLRSLTSSTSPHPYAYAYAYANGEGGDEGDDDNGPRGPRTAPPTTTLRPGFNQQSPPRITFSSDIGHGHTGGRRDGLKNSVSTPNLRLMDSDLNGNGNNTHGHGRGHDTREGDRTPPPPPPNGPSSAQSSPRKPKRSPTVWGGKGDKWLTAETWCDALLFPRPRLKIKQSGENGLARDRKLSAGAERLLSPASTPIPPDEVGVNGRAGAGGEGRGETVKAKGRSMSITSRVLAHSRSLVELRNGGGVMGGNASKGKEREVGGGSSPVNVDVTANPSYTAYVKPGKGVVPVDEEGIEREVIGAGAGAGGGKPIPRSRPPDVKAPRPRSFAQDDLALPSPVPSLSQVLAEGQLLEDQRRKWQAQATNSFSNSLSRTVSRARSKSLTSQGQRRRPREQAPPVPELNLKNQGNLSYLAARSLLGNQDVIPVSTAKPRNRSRSRSRSRSVSRLRGMSQSQDATTTATTTVGSHGHGHTSSLSKTLSKSSKGTTSLPGPGSVHSRQHSRNDSWSKTAIHMAKSSVSLCGLGGRNDGGVLNIDSGLVDGEERKRSGLGVALDSSARRHEAKVLRLAELMKPSQQQQEYDEFGRRAMPTGVVAVRGAVSPVPSHVSDARMGIAVSTPPPDDLLDRESLSMPSHPYAQGGHSLSSTYRSVQHQRHPSAVGSDYVGPHPTQRPQSHDPIPEGPARHRLPPQAMAQQHPYALATSKRDSYLPKFIVDQPRLDSNVSPSAKMWTQVAPGVVREVLPRDIQYSPYIDTPDVTEGNKSFSGKVGLGFDGINEFGGGFVDRKGVGELLYSAAAHEKRESTDRDSGLGMMDDQPYQVTKQAAFIPEEEQRNVQSAYSYRAPVQYDASRPPYLDPRHRRYPFSQLQDQKDGQPRVRPLEPRTKDHLSPRDTRDTLQPPTSLHTPTTDTSSVNDSPPRIFGGPDDNLEHFQDLFYKPGSRNNTGQHGVPQGGMAYADYGHYASEADRSTVFTQDIRDSVVSESISAIEMMLAGAPIGRRNSRTPSGIPWDVNRRGSGLTSLARQLSEELEMMAAEREQTNSELSSSPRFGSLGSIFLGGSSMRGPNVKSPLGGPGSIMSSSGGRDMEFVFGDVPRTESPTPMDEEVVVEPAVVFQPLARLPEDVDSSRASSFMDDTDEDATQLLRVGLIESVATPPAVAGDRRSSFIGSFVQGPDAEQEEHLPDPPPPQRRPRPINRSNAEHSANPSSPDARSTGYQSLLIPSDPARSSYMTVSTAMSRMSRMSGLSDFPIPPSRDDITISMSMTPNQLSLLNSYFDEVAPPQSPSTIQYPQQQDYPSPPPVPNLSLPPIQPRPQATHEPEEQSPDRERNPRLTFGGSDADEVVAELVATLTKNGTRGFHS